MTTKPLEHIRMNPDVPELDAWVCLCGNTPPDHGFYPCLRNGSEVEPVPADWPEPLYRCANCGRIILDRPPYPVVGCKAPQVTVAVYFVTRRFGGPEEGGWWYDAGEPSEAHAALTRGFDRWSEAESYRAHLCENVLPALNEGRRELSSVLSDGRFAVEIQEGQPRPFPDRRPHY